MLSGHSINEFIRDLPDILRYKQLSSSSVPRPKEHASPDAVTKKEINNLVNITQANPMKQFMVSFFVLISTTFDWESGLNVPLYLRHMNVIFSIGFYNGVIECKFSNSSIDFVVEPNMELVRCIKYHVFMDNQIDIICFLPAISIIADFVSARSDSRLVESYTKIYHNSILDAMLSIVSKYPIVVIGILAGCLGREPEYYTSMSELLNRPIDEQVDRLTLVIKGLKMTI